MGNRNKSSVRPIAAEPPIAVSTPAPAARGARVRRRAAAWLGGTGFVLALAGYVVTLSPLWLLPYGAERWFTIQGWLIRFPYFTPMAFLFFAGAFLAFIAASVCCRVRPLRWNRSAPAMRLSELRAVTDRKVVALGVVWGLVQVYDAVRALRGQETPFLPWFLGGLALLAAGYLLDRRRRIASLPTIKTAVYWSLFLLSIGAVSAYRGGQFWLLGIFVLACAGGATFLRSRLRAVDYVVWFVATASCWWWSHDLGSWRYSYIGDEWGFYELARQFVSGDFPRYLLSARGVFNYHPVLSGVFQGVSLWLFGGDNVAWRLSNLQVLAFCVPVVYALVRRWAGTTAGVCAGICFGCSHLLAGFGKIGYNNDPALFFLLAPMLALELAVSSGSVFYLVSCGTLTALGFYSFGITKLFPLLVPLWLMLGWRFRAKRKFWMLAAVAAIALCGVLPLLNDAEATAVQFQQTVFHNEAVGASYGFVPLLADNLLRSLTLFLLLQPPMYFTQGPHADPITGTLALLGIAGLLVAGWRGRRAARALLLSYLMLVVLIGCGHKYAFPPLTRMFVFVGFYAIFAGIGFRQMLALLGGWRRRRAARVWLMAGLLAAMLPLNLAFTFRGIAVAGDPLATLIRLYQSNEAAGAPFSKIYAVFSPGTNLSEYLTAYHANERVKLLDPVALMKRPSFCDGLAPTDLVLVMRAVATADALRDRFSACWPSPHVTDVLNSYGAPNFYAISASDAPWLR